MAPIALADYRGPMDYPATARKVDIRCDGYAWAFAEVSRSLETGVDVRLPSLSDRHDAEGEMVSERLSNCDAKQEQLLFRLLTAALNSTDANVLAAATAVRQFIADNYADLYAAGRA